ARLAARRRQADDRDHGAGLVSPRSVPARSQADRHRRLLRRHHQDPTGPGLAAARQPPRRPRAHLRVLRTPQGSLPVTGVPFLDLKAHVAALRTEIDAALGRVLDSGCFVLGPEGDAFEGELADQMGARHAVAVANGTEAIQLALEALGLGPGAE